MSPRGTRSEPERIVVVGGGLAAGRAVASLRESGWDGQLTVLCDEAPPPYERPPLSKELLLHREASPSVAYVNQPMWYVENNVDLRTATRVDRIALDT